MNTAVKQGSVWAPYLVLAAFALVMLSLLFGTDQATKTRINKEGAQQQEYHNAVMATTYDASNGSGIARARHAMTYNPDGSCTITVQQYVRKSTNDLFINPPRIETTAFTPKQCER